MKMNEFRSLPQEDQLDLIYKEGVYIGKRKEGKLTVVLYQIDSFYVEVAYQKYRHLVTHILCSESTSFLDPYLLSSKS